MSTERSIEHQAGERTARQRRGIQLFEDGAFERLSRDVFVVENPERKSAHIVDLANSTCDCPDYEHHAHIEGFVCYHLIGCGLYRAWLRRSAQIIAPIFGRLSGPDAA